MGFVDGIITYPVGYADIQNALGDASTDLRDLCRSNGINMWAKFKPVEKNMLFPNQTQMNSNYTWKKINGTGGLGNNAWYKGNNGNFGIGAYSVHKTTTDTNRMISALNTIAIQTNGGLNGWTYTKPSGTTTSTYRTSDFLGYNSKAVAPVKTLSSIDSNIYAVPASGGKSGSTWEYEYQIMGSADAAVVSDVDTRDYLLASDIIGSCYLGVAIYQKVQRELDEVYEAIAWATGKVWQGQGIGNGSVNKYQNYVEALLTTGVTYYALPVFFSEELPQIQTTQAGTSPYPNHSIQPSTNFYVWTVPFVDFLPFNLQEASTRQTYGYPTVGNKKILPPVNGYGAYATKVYIDSSYSNYYNGGTIPAGKLWVAVVSDSWNGVWVTGDQTNIAYIAQITSAVTIRQNEKKQVYYWGSGGNHTALSLSTEKTWRVIIRIDNEDKEYLLMPTIDPTAPV